MKDEKEKQKHVRLVLVPSPFQGHLNPMIQLAATLKSKGFLITIAQSTKLNSPNSSDHPQFDILPMEDKLSDEDMSSSDKTGLVLLLNENCKAPFQDCLSKLIQLDEIVCIIYDEISYFAQAAAYNLKIPSILFRTTNAITFLVRSSPAFRLRAEGRLPLPDPMSHEPAPEHPILRLKDLPISNFGPIQSFFKLLSNAMNIGSSKAIICNTMTCLEDSSLTQFQKQNQVPIFAIGPLHKRVPVSLSTPCCFLEEDKSCITWLDKQTINSVIYICTGSIVTNSKKDIAEMAWGLANSRQPFLWVFRPGSVHGSKWIEALPEGFVESVGERGCIVKWAPQREVLGHEAVGGFWSHCGWNSILESICEGVPLLCRPGFGDQKVTARFVSEVWRVGLQLDTEMERGEIEKAVKRLMVDEQGKEMRKRAMEFKLKAELEIREGGSSYNALNDLVEFIYSF
ncbi:UDP-glycosyltransferase 76E2-like isoform X1 [Euphorbia lathyris]|uniref:UDP-glycosyltransferase 76E2-like isoform X1 n=1 Tax=Euphorbia lathyris TaxID=212925 RepID=UPI003313BDA3